MPHSDPLMREFERIVREGGRIAQGARSELQRELKPDGSVVTNGDRLVEEFFRKELPGLAKAPVWGEEFGFAHEDENGLWTVDPVDGTTNYAFDSPLWGVTAALVQGPSVEFGAVFLPDLGEMYLGRRGHGAFFNGQPMPPIPKGPVQKHEPCGYCDHLMRRFPGQKWPGKMRCIGAFVVEAVFVGRQRLRGMIGVREKLYDIAGALAVCQELEADIRYADGSPLLIEELKDDRPIDRPWLIFPTDSGYVFPGEEAEGPAKET